MRRDHSLGQSGASSQCQQFMPLERGAHRDQSVADEHVIPLKKPLRGRQESKGQRSPLQVDREHRASSQFSEAGEKFDNLVIGEMMQEKGAEDKIEACGFERELKGVSGQFRLCRAVEMKAQPVE